MSLPRPIDPRGAVGAAPASARRVNVIGASAPRTLAAEVDKSVEEAVAILEDGSEQRARVVRAPGLDFDFVFVLVDGSDPVAIRVETVDGSTYSVEIEAPA